LQPEPRMDALVGTVLEGAYRITRLVGEGGMGAVYEAVQLRLNKRVAIKLMSRDLAANREALARFHREAEITSHLGHPHLVTVIDFGTAESGEPTWSWSISKGKISTTACVEWVACPLRRLSTWSGKSPRR